MPCDIGADSTVERILREEKYTGTMVMFRTELQSVGGRQIRPQRIYNPEVFKILVTPATMRATDSESMFGMITPIRLVFLSLLVTTTL